MALAAVASAQSIVEWNTDVRTTSTPLRYEVSLRVHLAQATGTFWLWIDALDADREAPCEIDLRTTGPDAVAYQLGCRARFTAKGAGADEVTIRIPFIGKSVIVSIDRTTREATFVSSDIDIGSVTLTNKGKVAK